MSRHKFTVIGAGCAGILTIGKLLDSNVDPQQILWIDDTFNIGRMGSYYRNVPSNDTVQDWIDVLHSYDCYKRFSHILSGSYTEPRLQAAPEGRGYGTASNQSLGVIYHVLMEITKWLQTIVIWKKGFVTSMKYEHERWHVKIKYKNNLINTDKVVLATGSHPVELNYQNHLYIPLDVAIDEQKLSEYVTKEDTVCVVGSGQSAILLLKYLSDLHVARTVNLYKNSLEETVNSLKATTKRWATKFLLRPDQQRNVIRVQNSSANRAKWLPQCTKLIYAVGYERNPLPKVRGVELDLESNNGVLGPNVFGVGIAFPDKEVAPDGHIIKKVGLTSFTRFLNKHIEDWL